MKKVFFLFIATSFIFLQANAQKPNFGVQAGMTGSNLKAKESGVTMSLDTKIGFYAGILSEFKVSDQFAIEPQLYFSQMGAKVNLKMWDETFSASAESGYLFLPILLKYKVDQLSVFAGPQVGYLLYAKSKSEGETEDTKDAYKPIDVSGVLGIGYSFANGFGLNASYQMGLVNIAKEAEGEDHMKNSAFRIGLHYFFKK